MSADPEQDVTRLVIAAREGDRASKDELFRLVYEELRGIAHRTPMVAREGQTMQATVLANEAYIRFVRRIPPPPPGEPESRATFFRTVAMAMRTILRDYWRQQRALKRGGDAEVMIFDGAAHADPKGDPLEQVDFLDLDAALDRLERHNKRWFDVVMHRYFAGRDIEETASLMGLGVTTVKKDWKAAKAWLRETLSESSG